jgi:hypothetical protein
MVSLQVISSADDKSNGLTPLALHARYSDDLRTQLSVYPEGGAYMKTPNIERIAKQSVVSVDTLGDRLVVLCAHAFCFVNGPSSLRCDSVSFGTVAV